MSEHIIKAEFSEVMQKSYIIDSEKLVEFINENT